MQSSLAIFNQTNGGVTDRRFAYFQHSNSLLKNLYLFCSFEVDLYKLDSNWKPANTVDLTGSYISLNYQPWRPLSLSMSYDARKNVYYYETYKTLSDSLLDKETRQGYKFNFNYRPFKFLSWGANVGYHLPTTVTDASYNGSTNISCPNIPFIDVSSSINATYLDMNKLNCQIYGISLSRDIIEGKLSADLEYRRVNYKFSNSEDRLIQNIGEFGLSWRFSKKLMFSADFEETVEQYNYYQRAFINLSYRF
jgi:hypothetical protein